MYWHISDRNIHTRCCLTGDNIGCLYYKHTHWCATLEKVRNSFTFPCNQPICNRQISLNTPHIPSVTGTAISKPQKTEYWIFLVPSNIIPNNELELNLICIMVMENFSAERQWDDPTTVTTFKESAARRAMLRWSSWHLCSSNRKWSKQIRTYLVQISARLLVIETFLWFSLFSPGECLHHTTDHDCPIANHHVITSHDCISIPCSW